LKSVAPLSNSPIKNTRKQEYVVPWGKNPKSIYKKLKKEIKGHYFKEPEEEIFDLIRAIILERPTCEYRRVRQH
jgi:hypothetical protein